MSVVCFDSNDTNHAWVAVEPLALALLSFQPIVPGHILICPRRPVMSYDELRADEWQAMMTLKSKICRALTRTLDAQGFNFAWNEGAVAGQTVPHLHLHVLPRKQGDAGIYQYEPRLFLYRPGSRAISPYAELEEVAALIKQNLVTENIVEKSPPHQKECL